MAPPLSEMVDYESLAANRMSMVANWARVVEPDFPKTAAPADARASFKRLRVPLPSQAIQEAAQHGDSCTGGTGSRMKHEKRLMAERH